MDTLRSLTAIAAAAIALGTGGAWISHSIASLETRLAGDIRTVRLEAGTLASALEKTIVSAVPAPEHPFPECRWIETVPFRITESGRYCLPSHLDASTLKQDAIAIEVDYVTIDGQGFSLFGPDDAGTAVRGVIGIDRRGITIQNLRTTGFSEAIVFGSTDAKAFPGGMYEPDRKSRDIVIENNRIDRPTFQGIHVSADNFSIAGNTVANVGPSSRIPNAFATAINARGNGCLIKGNQISGGEPSGTGEAVGIALYQGAGCIVEDNVVSFTTVGDVTRNFGIWTRPENGAAPYVTGNFVSGAHYAIGPDGYFKDNVGVNGVCAMFVARDYDLNKTFDLGGNFWREPAGLDLANPAECPSVAGNMAKFWANPSKDTAYLVATAINEERPTEMVETLTWLLLAAKLGHQDALAVADDPRKFGYTTDQIDDAVRALEENFATVINATPKQ